jgi:hypothetical protein
LFELQAILVLAGTILVVASAFLGDAKETQQAISSWAAMLPG